MPRKAAPDEEDSLVIRANYQRDGFVFPFRIFSHEEVESFRGSYFEFRGRHAEELADDRRSAQMLVHNQTHLVLDWVADIAAREEILDLVELFIGGDMALWHSQWIVKMPGAQGLANAPLPWHQDAVNLAFDPPEAVTVWIALSEATPDNGGMKFVPGSHTGGLLPFESNQRDERSPVTRGPIVGVDTSSPVDVRLHPGEVSVHHPCLVHASATNTSDAPRVALLLRYVTMRGRSLGPHPVEGVLFRGRAPGSFRVLDPAAPGDRGELQCDNLRRLQENATVVGY
jgi:non-haem Fe2+, alpha-ketoglutarate-dependent halogenase